MASQSKPTTIRAAIAAANAMRSVSRKSRCPCGCGGSWDDSVSGTIGGKPAIWMGCSRRRGSTVGGGLTGDDYHIAHAVIAACSRLGISTDDVMATIPGEVGSGWCQEFDGPLALAVTRERLTQIVADKKAGALGVGPAEWIADHNVSYALRRMGLSMDDVCDGIYLPAPVPSLS